MKRISKILVELGLGAAAATGAAAAGSVLTVRHALRRATRPAPAPDAGAAALRAKLLEDYPPERVSITSDDGLLLRGMILTPPDPRGLALLVHGYRSDGLREFGGGIARYYLQRGWRVLLVDDRAHGESEGDFVGFGTLDCGDLLQWLRYGALRFGRGCPMVLHGVSMGAAAVLMTAGMDGLPAGVKAIVADCGFTNAWEEFRHVLRQRTHLPTGFSLRIADRWARRYAGYGLREGDAPRSLRHAQVPVLFIHGAADDFVPVWMTEQNYEACASFKMKYICPGAGHAESWARDPAAYARVLDDFFGQVLA